jgi:hypothetical protein
MNQSSIRRNRTVAVSGALDGLLEGPMAQRSGVVVQVQRRWRQVCPLLGAQSWPLSLSAVGVLRVAAASGSVAQELKYQEPTIVDGVNLLAGYAAVKKVSTVVQTLPVTAVRRVKTPPAPPAAAVDSAKSVCEAVRDEDLRDALARLGAWIIRG